MSHLFQTLKKQIKGFSADRYFQKQAKNQEVIAQKLIRSTLKVHPEHRLSAFQERMIDAYAKEKLGSIRFAPMLQAYSVYQGEFKEGWIPDNYFEQHVLPRTNGFHNTISDLRQLAKRILQADDMPDLGYYVRGCWMGVNNQLMTKAQAKEFFFSQTPQIIVKTNASMRGEGFYRLNADDFDHFEDWKLMDFVIQRPIQQHEWFGRFSRDSVATLRITTVKPWGKAAKKMAAFMRFGRDGVDRVTASSRLVVGVTPSGKLDRYSLDSDWNLSQEHPDSKIAWEGLQLPGFEQMVRRCEDLHDREATMEIIGWDVIWDQNNTMQLMEWNTGYPGIVHSEITTGPNFLETDWSELWNPNYKRVRKS
ncbi:sugar-transfer associated ATP-grasp domain-containing protein [Algoriphagus taiwanensis]|uniref:Alpha-L-glutamate ligase-related protein ATP-grasp domain-containing protein n=1 Tax=Algoriphagus taiwanensis TaxID=1445656 RepID=A0ABQ6Q0G9_9BACT|nr:hypothetical protein Ataiwa_18450 [Algoriphagus taiwanensis]